MGSFRENPGVTLPPKQLPDVQNEGRGKVAAKPATTGAQNAGKNERLESNEMEIVTCPAKRFAKS